MPCSIGNLPRTRDQPLFSALAGRFFFLAGRFLSTTPPGKSLNALLSDQSMNFPGGPVVKNSPCNARYAGSIPGCGTKIPHPMEQLSQSTATTEPMPQLDSSCAPIKTRGSQMNFFFKASSPILSLKNGLQRNINLTFFLSSRWWPFLIP